MAFNGLAICFCFAAVCLQLIQCENWALLVAGSMSYYNYRHQADVCHAYHVLRSHGILQENIVTMMYDDIAYNKENPFPGNIINMPNGPNLYPGVVIDYKKEDVTPEVFLAALSGDAKKVKALTGHEGKVIKSGPDDHIFVNFVDHGAPGLLAFPDDMLYARDLMSTIKKMHRKKSYKKMVFYVEACESGSMFYNLLPDDIDVYASTAANRSQSSYACYYDKHRETYLGDVYSVNWMQDSDKENLETETLQKQFLITREETNTSQVKEYGDMSISRMTVGEFQGDEKADVSSLTDLPLHHPTEDAVPAREALLHMLDKKKKNAHTAEEAWEIAQQIKQLMEHNARVDALFRDIVEWLARETTGSDRQQENVLRFVSEQMYQAVKNERMDITQWECYEYALDALRYNCPRMELSQDYYALGQLFVLVNLCEQGHPGYSVAAAITNASRSNPELCALA